MLWRQGDIYIEPASSIPESALRLQDAVLAEGEITGHSHRIEDLASAAVFEDRGQLYLEVIADRARIVHEEHGPIELARGSYRVWRQREFDPLWGNGIRHDLADAPRFARDSVSMPLYRTVLD